MVQISWKGVINCLFQGKQKFLPTQIFTVFLNLPDRSEIAPYLLYSCLLNSNKLHASSKKNGAVCFTNNSVHLQQILIYRQGSCTCLLLVELMFQLMSPASVKSQAENEGIS